MENKNNKRKDRFYTKWQFWAAIAVTVVLIMFYQAATDTSAPQGGS